MPPRCLTTVRTSPNPCQVLGIPASKLKTALAAPDDGAQLKALLDASDRPATYKGWVTPTWEQNNRFTNGKTDKKNEAISGSPNVAWNANGGDGSATNPPTVTFMNASYGGNAVLPAAGYRDGRTGAIEYQGTNGDYWSQAELNMRGAAGLVMGSFEVIPSGNCLYNGGFAIRCVRPE